MKKILAALTIVFCFTTKAQVVTTFAGSTMPGTADGTGIGASFDTPTFITGDGNGNLYVTDSYNNGIRKIVIATGVVTTLAGSPTSGSADGIGTAASFSYPAGIVYDGGNLYVSDLGNNEIRKIDIATAAVTTLCGSTTSGNSDGTGVGASFYLPSGITNDGNGNLYVSDEGNHLIRKIVIATGVVTTLAGSGQGFSDGIGASASFNQPDGIVYDGNGNLYVADNGNSEIRKIVIATGLVTTFAGSTTTGHADGIGAAASFYYPGGLTYDGNGNLYIGDGNNEIRKIDIATGMVSTLCGSTTQGSADGTGAAAGFFNPIGIICVGSFDLFVVDNGNNEIRKIVLPTTGKAPIESSSVDQILIYPNPSSGKFTLELRENTSVEIYNSLGEKVFQSRDQVSGSVIDLSSQPDGVYSVTVKGAGKQFAQRVIKD